MVRVATHLSLVFLDTPRPRPSRRMTRKRAAERAPWPTSQAVHENQLTPELGPRRLRPASDVGNPSKSWAGHQLCAALPRMARNVDARPRDYTHLQAREFRIQSDRPAVAQNPD